MRLTTSDKHTLQGIHVSEIGSYGSVNSMPNLSSINGCLTRAHLEDGHGDEPFKIVRLSSRPLVC
jgi:hypothetical protein